MATKHLMHHINVSHVKTTCVTFITVNLR